MTNSSKPTNASTVQLGRSGLKVSSAVMGTMTFGSSADETESGRMFDACLDRGIFTFDCANVYGQGKAEGLLGKFIKERRAEVVITTKAFNPAGVGPNARGSSRIHLRRAVEASLKRLDTDTIEIFFLHGFDQQTELEETLSALESLVERGLIQYVGVSNFSAWQTERLHMLARSSRVRGLACTQPMYSLLKRQCEVEILPQAASAGLGVFSYSPLAAGMLTGKFQRGAADPESRLLVNKMYQTRFADIAAPIRVTTFLELCAAHSVSPIETALAWAARHPAITAPILGARSLAQLDAQLGFLGLRLTSELASQLNEIFPPPALATDREEERH